MLFWWLRLRGTVIKYLWWQVPMLMAYTAGIVAINKYGDITLSFGQALIPVTYLFLFIY
jgi:hypothetical protein